MIIACVNDSSSLWLLAFRTRGATAIALHRRPDSVSTAARDVFSLLLLRRTRTRGGGGHAAVGPKPGPQGSLETVPGVSGAMPCGSDPGLFGGICLCLLTKSPVQLVSPHI